MTVRYRSLYASRYSDDHCAMYNDYYVLIPDELHSVFILMLLCLVCGHPLHSYHNSANIMIKIVIYRNNSEVAHPQILRAV